MIRESKAGTDFNQFSLITQKRFGPFFFTQFLGAFNDNIFRNGLIILLSFKGVEVLGLNASQIANVAEHYLSCLIFYFQLWQVN